MKRIWFVPLALSLLVLPCRAQWEAQEGGTKARLRGLSVVSRQVAWVSGTGGACLRTTDGGKTWIPRSVPSAASLDFRDVHALDVDTAYLLSIGAGELSRVYKTSDGGSTWTLQHQNRDPKVFLDAIAFWDADHGLALGDPVDGRFVILSTDDGGQRWTPAPRGAMPPALPGEGAFAASGTCLVVLGDQDAWFGTGGAAVSRVFRSFDRGRSWTVHETPIRAGVPSAGIFSLAFRDAKRGVAVGGDYKAPDVARTNVALTVDGGQTWSLPRDTRPAGYRSAVAFVPGAGGPTLIAVGPTGTDVSTDDGKTWKGLGAPGFDAVGFAAVDAGRAVGDGGRIARFEGPLPGGR